MAFTTQYNSNRWLNLASQGYNCAVNGNWRGGLGVLGGICGNFGTIGNSIGRILSNVGGSYYGSFGSYGSYGNYGSYTNNGFGNIFCDALGRPNYTNMAIASGIEAVIGVGIDAYNSTHSSKDTTTHMIKSSATKLNNELGDIEAILKDDTKIEAKVDKKYKDDVSDAESKLNNADTAVTTAKARKTILEAKGTENLNESEKEELKTLNRDANIEGSIAYLEKKRNEAQDKLNEANTEFSKQKELVKKDLEEQKRKIEKQLNDAEIDYYDDLFKKGNKAWESKQIIEYNEKGEPSIKNGSTITKDDFYGVFHSFNNAQPTQKLQLAKTIVKMYENMNKSYRDSDMSGATQVAIKYIELHENDKPEQKDQEEKKQA